MSLRVHCAGYSIPLAIVASSTCHQDFLVFWRVGGSGRMEKDTEKRIDFLFEYGNFMTGMTRSAVKTRTSQLEAHCLLSDGNKIAELFVTLLLNYLNVIVKMVIYCDIWSSKIWSYLDEKTSAINKNFPDEILAPNLRCDLRCTWNWDSCRKSDGIWG
jgi:hypothetical protein